MRWFRAVLAGQAPDHAVRPRKRIGRSARWAWCLLVCFGCATEKRAGLDLVLQVDLDEAMAAYVDDAVQAAREQVGRSGIGYSSCERRDRVASAPMIRSQISGEGVIVGRFSAREAAVLAAVLRAGALPATVKVVE